MELRCVGVRSRQLLRGRRKELPPVLTTSVLNLAGTKKHAKAKNNLENVLGRGQSDPEMKLSA
jgi:hypothetical protein